MGCSSSKGGANERTSEANGEGILVALEADFGGRLPDMRGEDGVRSNCVRSDPPGAGRAGVESSGVESSLLDARHEKGLARRSGG